MKTTAIAGAWTTAKVIEVLGNRVARAAVAGKPSPVAARVLERLEGMV